MPTYEEILFKSGDLFLPTKILNFLDYYYVGSNTTVFYIKNWTLIHFLTGILFAYFFRKYSATEIFIITFLFHSIWEVWQIYVRNTKIEKLRDRVDILVDSAFYMAGVAVFVKCIAKKKF